MHARLALGGLLVVTLVALGAGCQAVAPAPSPAGPEATPVPPATPAADQTTPAAPPAPTASLLVEVNPTPAGSPTLPAPAEASGRPVPVISPTVNAADQTAAAQNGANTPVVPDASSAARKTTPTPLPTSVLLPPIPAYGLSPTPTTTGGPQPLATGIFLPPINPIWPTTPGLGGQRCAPASRSQNDIRNATASATPQGLSVTVDYTLSPYGLTAATLSRLGILARAFLDNGRDVPGAVPVVQHMCPGDGRATLTIQNPPGGANYTSTLLVVCMVDRARQPQEFHCTGFQYRQAWPTAAGAVATVPPPNGATSLTTRRLTFARGAIAATVHGQLTPGAVDRWLVKAAGGQTMTLAQVGSQHVLAVTGADGAVLLATGGATSWSGTLPSTQDYLIDVIGSSSGPGSYALTVTIPPPGTAAPATQAAAAPSAAPAARRITFAAGAIAASVRGSVSAGANRWVIKAGAGQTMTTQLAPADGSVILAVQGADGNVLLASSTAANTWRGALPLTQDYFIDVLAGSAADGNYTLTVTIPPR